MTDKPIYICIDWDSERGVPSVKRQCHKCNCDIAVDKKIAPHADDTMLYTCMRCLFTLKTPEEMVKESAYALRPDGKRVELGIMPELVEYAKHYAEEKESNQSRDTV